MYIHIHIHIYSAKWENIHIIIIIIYIKFSNNNNIENSMCIYTLICWINCTVVCSCPKRRMEKCNVSSMAKQVSQLAADVGAMCMVLLMHRASCFWEWQVRHGSVHLITGIYPLRSFTRVMGAIFLMFDDNKWEWVLDKKSIDNSCVSMQFSHSEHRDI